MIPSGSVTFLFTDIEGSTKLAQKNNDAYLAALDKHHEVLYEVIDSNNGFVFKIIGDSFCCAFSNSTDAVNAAIKSQIKLKSIDWKDTEIKVRMGIHSGEAEFINKDYSGYVTLSRSQRIMSVAYGEQILITQEVFDILKENHETEFSFKDFGERKLKDIIKPEHIYQIVSEGLRTDFPPLKSLDARQNNLPTLVSQFVGRRKEIDEIKQLFTKIRLLSLTGAGGTGKTRLAIQLASELIDEFENGIWIIEFSPVTDPDLIVKEISTVLNLKEDPAIDGLQALRDFLKNKSTLLIFDNCEHLLNRCAQVSETLLSYCTKLKIISTSRESFNIQGETLYRIPPLSMPENIKKESFESLIEYESVKLFLDRAVSVNPKFTLTKENIYAVAEICKKLDGIPLAIELASKRVNVIPVEKILERLDDRFKLLNSGNSTALPRQKTLRALIDWSYDMLNPSEQILLQRLSIFMGGWTLETSEEICSDETIDQYEILDLMESLLNKSLIYFNEANGKGRFGILESIKYYALEKLTDKTANCQKHLNYFLNFSSFAKQKEKGMGQIEWLSTMSTELDNIRGNTQWALKNNPEDAVRIVINTYDFWNHKGYLQEGFDTSMKVLNSVDITNKKLKADLLSRLAIFCYEQGKFTELENFSNEALNLYREENDEEGILNTLNVLGQKSFIELDLNKAVKLYEEALALSDSTDSKVGKATTLYNLSFPVGNLGDFQRSISLQEEALKLSREIKNEHLTAQVLLSLSVALTRRTGDIKKAAVYSEESLLISRRIDDQYLISVNLVHLADLKLNYESKNYDEAEYILLEAYKISKDCGYNMNLFPIRIHLGRLYTETENFTSAINIYKEYLNERDKPGGEFFMNDVIAGFGRIFYERKKYIEAVKLFGLIESLSKGGKIKPLNKNFNLRDTEKDNILNELGEEEYRKYWNEGNVMKLDDAVFLCVNIDN
ncbi:MAG: tetratricopeptide repeat protein [Ignavibacteria bacterium]|nr:tetratricopeptide repeat protein [Ignavibacteria bacterium]